LKRGIREERELIHRLDSLGFAVLRAPASGSRTRLDRPDILAGRKGFILAIEVKTSKKATFYIRKESVDQLVRFSGRFGAKPYVAIKFKHKGLDWFLIEPENLIKTVKGYKVTLNHVKNKGRSLESIVTRSLAEYI
jgi:Holliday junction resolvase